MIYSNNHRGLQLKSVGSDSDHNNHSIGIAIVKMASNTFLRRDRKIVDPKANDDMSFDLPQIVATVILEVRLPRAMTSSNCLQCPG